MEVDDHPAVVFTRDRTIDMARRPYRALGPTEVRLRPLYVGICGTDLHAPVLDHFAPGVVMGHEFSAEVVEVGSRVSDLEPRVRVVVNPNGNVCGSCWACLSDHPNLCHEAVFRAGIGVHRDGGMSTDCIVDRRVLHTVPDGLAAEEAAWVEPLATAIRGVRRAGVMVGDAAVVIGAGPIGLLTVQVLRCAGMQHIAVVEPVAFRRDVATRLGADEVAATPGALLDGLGPPDCVFECSGAPDSLAAAIELVRPAGVVVVVGLAPTAPRVPSFPLVGKEVDVRGSIIYADEFPMAIELLRRHTVDVGTLTSAILPLERFREAFEALRAPSTTVKVLLQP